MPNHTGNRHRRRSIRLPDYDYTTPAAYFVTVCTHGHKCLFGDVVDGRMWLNKLGNIVKECWREIPEHFSNVELDEFVIMPNHLHGLLIFAEPCRDTACRVPKLERYGKPVSGSLSTVIRSFKSAAKKNINKLRGTLGVSIWQSRFYEHVVRRENKINLIREYILNNPLRWKLDRENPLFNA